MISIITPWRDHPELIPDYEAAVQGARVVVVGDEHTAPENRQPIISMLERLRAVLISQPDPRTADLPAAIEHRREELSLELKPFSFAGACNVGLSFAIQQGIEQGTNDVILMLNNDISAAPGWLAQVERDVRGDGLYGPETHMKMIHGRPVLYVDGWCVAARREVWERLGGFDAETFQRPYWEDVDLSWRAVQLGYTLHQTRWPVTHLGNTTSRTTPGAYDASEANGEAFKDKVRRALWLA